MKIPVWLAAVLVTGALGACGIAFEHLSSNMAKMNDEIVELKVDVGMIKARVAPELARIEFNSSQKVTATP
jgi:hypothetical protein